MYPPFGLLDADYPVSVTISLGRLNRAATDQGKANELLARGDAGVNRSSNLMSAAVADGSVIGPPG